MFFEDKIKNNKTEFLAKVKSIAKDLDIEPDWLMSAMYLESSLNSSAINSIGCVGLIQFCPIYLTDIGLTSSYVSNLSNVEQLDLVKQYIVKQNKTFNNGKKIKNYLDLHTLIFFPKAIQFKRNQTLKYGSLTAKQIAQSNTVIDLNKDLEITKKEFEGYAKQQFKKSGLTQKEQNKLFNSGIYITEFKIIVVSLAIAITAFIVYKVTK